MSQLSLIGGTKLTSRSQWPIWYIELQRQCQITNIWHLINPELIANVPSVQYQGDMSQLTTTDWLMTPAPTLPTIAKLKHELHLRNLADYNHSLETFLESSSSSQDTPMTGVDSKPDSGNSDDQRKTVQPIQLKRPVQPAYPSIDDVKDDFSLLEKEYRGIKNE
jgi:hypothetical protein